MIIDLVSSIWKRSDLPVAVLLAHRCVTVLIQDIGYEHREVFGRCNQKLLHWWQAKEESLLKIYEEDIGACWRTYYQFPKDTPEEEAGQKIMLGLYIQLRILQRYIDDDQNAKLGNDLRDIYEGNLVEVVEAVTSKLPAESLKEWEAWMEGLVVLDETAWSTQVVMLAKEGDIQLSDNQVKS